MHSLKPQTALPFWKQSELVALALVAVSAS
jgi:hypothetical protein